MATGARITGLRETVRNLEKLGVDVADLKEAFGEISRAVATEADGLVAKDTGALAATIRPAKAKNKAVVRAGTGTKVPYAGVINYGRSGAGGSGFLTRPANDNAAEHVRTIESNLEDLMRRHRL